MIEPKVIYQTISNKYSVTDTQNNGPIECKDLKSIDWLGKGYYFWDSHIELAHSWGQIMYNKKKESEYFICESSCTLNEKCYDLHESGKKRIEFEFYANQAIKKLEIDKSSLLIRDVVIFLRSKEEFISKYDSIRILGTNSFQGLVKGEAVRFFDEDNRTPRYLKFPPVQFCFFDERAQSVTGYKVVFVSNNVSNWA